METFKIRLKNLRNENKYTQHDVAKLLNIVDSSYAHWEQGRTEPNLIMLEKLANIFQVSTDYLLGIEDEAGISIVNTSLTDEEQRLIDYYRALPPELRSGVMTYTRTFYELDNKAKVHGNSNT